MESAKFTCFIFLPLLCLIGLSTADSTLKQLSNKIVRDVILSPDGKNVSFEGLLQVAEKLFAKFNEEAAKFQHGSNKLHQQISNKNLTSAALNRYLTIGNPEPSETQRQEISVMCDLCASLVQVAGFAVQLPGVDVWSYIVKAGKTLCPLVSKGLPQWMCDKYIENYEPIFRYITPNIVKSPYTVCTRASLQKLDCGTPDQQRFFWEVPIPEPLPDPLPPQITSEEAPKKDALSVLFMTDLHIDINYKPGSPANCKASMCCNSDSPPVNDPMWDNDTAGYWGDYRNCDMPVSTLDSMLRHINETHGDEIDIILLGGDYMAHDSWIVDREHNKALLQMVTDKLTENFPGKPYYLALGNHDASPNDFYSLPGSPETFSSQWLYDKLFDVSAKWLNRSESEATIKTGGFYTTLLKPGWRLVVLNDNFLYKTDFLVYGQPDIPDPHGQLTWFTQVLANAETTGERVLIMSHIQPGNNDLFQAFSYNYYRIIARFSHIIMAQFHGHSHDDAIVVYFDPETLTKPKSVSYVNPPGTPYGRNNIGYRLYDFDPKNYTLLNYNQYYADIEDVNNKDLSKIDWRFEYSAREAYSLQDMSPESWDNFLTQLQTNSTLFDIYRKHHKVSFKGDDETPCDKTCQRSLICYGYGGLSHAAEGYCEHFFPDPTEDDGSHELRCSSRFLKKS